jgi:hypothetical protein
MTEITAFGTYCFRNPEKIRIFGARDQSIGGEAPICNSVKIVLFGRQ